MADVAANPYVTSPLCVAQVNPASGRYVRAFFFLGSAPKAVLRAAQRGVPARADARRCEWSAADGATLRAFYGAKWRELLTAEDPPAPEAGGLASRRLVSFFGDFAHAASHMQDVELLGSAPGGAEPRGGGGDFVHAASHMQGGASPGSAPRGAEPRGGGGDSAELDFGDLGALDAPEIAERARPAAAGAVSWPAMAPAPPVYSEQAAYPEDTIFDLRQKLYCASGASPGRQHLFYYVNEEGPLLPYRLTLDGTPVAADWRALARSAGSRAGSETPATVAGIAVDPRVVERREGLRVEARDTLITLRRGPGARVTRAYFVDLYAALPPLGAPERPNDGLGAVLRDRYQFDLLYFGALVQYWPQLSPDACSLALAEPARVAHAYPALDPGLGALRARLEAERVVAERAQGWRAAAAKGGRAATAVTAATVRVAPAATRMRVAVRNVFDWVATSAATPAALARFDVEASLLPVAPGLRGVPIPVFAAKRHVTSFGPRAAPAVDRFVARLPRRESVAFIMARGRATAEPTSDAETKSTRASFAYLTLQTDGHYEIAADWREDDRVDFAAATDELATFVAPFIASVNAMGAVAFPVGGVLAVPGGSSKTPAGSGSSKAAERAALGAITASAFWPHALSAAAFRDLKDQFRIYERAGVVAVRGLQQAGAYTFSFRKGVVAYPADAAARAGAGRAIQNQYAWLTDETAAAQWAATFPGRTVRVFHRSADLRVEILATDSLAEFELIRRYVFSFLDSLLLRGSPQGSKAQPSKTFGKTDGPRPVSQGAARRLRRLQERDPNLFDLKKYDPDATVYSVLCQSGRQPHVYNEAEAGRLPAKRRAALAPYWNFTEQARAYYECPDARYPHLSWRAGQHPLGYFLPCCKMTRAMPGSRAAAINEQAARMRDGPAGRMRDGPAGSPAAPAAQDSAEDVSASRHVLAYGKAVPEGRISDLPREVADGLFLDALPPPYRLQLVGVEQAVPAVPRAGFAFALAYAADDENRDPDDALRELAAAAAAMEGTHFALGGGGGAAFASAAALADAILGAFVRRDADFSQFGPGGAAEATWPAILTELARYVFGVEVVTLADPTGLGAVSLEAPAAALVAIMAGGGGSATPRLALIATGPTGAYPIAMLDPKFFLRAPPSQRWMAVRRTFGAAGAEPVVDQVARIVREALSGSAGRAAALARTPDLELVTRFCRATPSVTLETRLANMHNLCYGVMLKRDAQLAYVPVRYSAYPADGTPVTFGARPAGALPAATLAAVVTALNAFIKETGAPYDPVRQDAPLVDAAGRVAGFCSGSVWWYFDPTGSADAELLVEALGAPVDAPIHFPYDAREVDLAIIAAQRSGAPCQRDELSALAAAAGARNRLYRLFLAEFSAVLRADRDPKMRAALSAAIRAADFASARSAGALRRRLNELLHQFPEDLLTVRDAVAAAVTTVTRDPGAAAIAAIAATTFAFDRRTLARLRAMPTRADVVAALKELMGGRIAARADPAPTPREGSSSERNMYTACGESTTVPQAHCDGRRLIVAPAKLEEFYDILAADVCNSWKESQLAAVAAGVFDPLEFRRRPDEWLRITVGAR